MAANQTVISCFFFWTVTSRGSWANTFCSCEASSAV